MRTLLVMLVFVASARADYLRQKGTLIYVVDSLTEQPIQADSTTLAHHPAMLTGFFEIVRELPPVYSRLVFIKPDEIE